MAWSSKVFSLFIMEGSMVSWRQTWYNRRSWEILHLDLQHNRSETLGVAWAYARPQITPPQWHTFFKKTITPQTKPHFQTVPFYFGTIFFQTTRTLVQSIWWIFFLFHLLRYNTMCFRPYLNYVAEKWHETPDCSASTLTL